MDGSTAIRLFSTDLGFKIFLQHPFLGVGVGNHIFYHFNHLSAMININPDLVTSYLTQLDTSFMGIMNAYVNTLADVGVVGFILYVALFGYTFTKAISIVKNDYYNKSSRILRTSSIGLIGIFLFANQDLPTMMRFFFFGINFVTLYLHSQSDRQMNS